MNKLTILVTGGLGFIGKHFINKCLSEGYSIINIDCHTYAADRQSLIEFEKHPKYYGTKKRIQELTYLPPCDYIVHFAAESHVDNSISDSLKFIDTNINGTHHILELIKNTDIGQRPKLIHISTDEVYGDNEGIASTENDSLKPSSPYSASKAAADMLVMSYGRTYNIDYNIVRMTNCYGHNQYPEKLIPRICLNLLKNKSIPLHGTGEYKRTWLHVEDAVKGILLILLAGNSQEIYNMAGTIIISNLHIAKYLIKLFHKDESYIRFIPNRLGQDCLYNINDNKIENQLGWCATRDFYDSLKDIANNFDTERFIRHPKYENIYKS